MPDWSDWIFPVWRRPNLAGKANRQAAPRSQERLRYAVDSPFSCYAKAFRSVKIAAGLSGALKSHKVDADFRRRLLSRKYARDSPGSIGAVRGNIALGNAIIPGRRHRHGETSTYK